MDHLTDKQLLEQLKHDTADQAVAEHLAECEVCAQALQAMKESWHVLGQWTVQTPQLDLTDRIMQQTAQPVYLWQTQALIRIAASIVIGVGAGAWLARTGTEPVSDQQVAEVMYLDVLSLNSSTGWTTPLLQDGQE